MKTTGTVKALSHNDYGTGLLVNDEWYNLLPGHKFGEIIKGDQLELEFTKSAKGRNRVDELKKIGHVEISPTQKPQGPWRSKSPAEEARVIRESALKAAVETLKCAVMERGISAGQLADVAITVAEKYAEWIKKAVP